MMTLDDLDYPENLTELVWVRYEFATIQYDYNILADAAKRIDTLFERLYNAKIQRTNS